MQNNKISKRNFADIDEYMQNEIKKGTFPGAVLGIVTDNEIVYQRAFGKAQIEPEERKISKHTIFGLASLTKVVATTSAVMKLIETGRINLWDYLKEYFPSISNDKEEMTIYHLLTHTSGYPAIVKLWDKEMSYEKKINYILNLPLKNEIDEVVEYSDPNFILLGELVNRVTDKTLHEFCRENIFLPLDMKQTVFNPLKNLQNVNKNDFAATEYCDWRERMIIGEVHDENAFSLRGISGHAGLFSTLNDLSHFVMMLLNNGKLNDTKLFAKRTIKTMVKNWTKNFTENRGLGWDLVNNFRSSGGILFSEKAFGHTGFTGTSLWIDPELKVGVILLTNRVHPSRENVKIISLRPRLHNLIINNMDRNNLI